MKDIFKDLYVRKLDKYKENSHHVEGWEKHLLQDYCSLSR